METIEINATYLNILVRVLGDQKEGETPQAQHYAHAILAFGNWNIPETANYWKAVIGYLDQMDRSTPIIHQELRFCEGMITTERIDGLRTQLLNHLRVYCIFIQFLKIHNISQEELIYINFRDRLFSSYIKIKKQLLQSNS